MDPLTISLYGAAANVTATGNLMISPLSIAYCTLLVYLGSAGSTRENFNSVFKFDSKSRVAPEKYVVPFADAMNTLTAVKGGENGGMQLKLANAAFFKTGFKVDSAYQTKITNMLRAMIAQYDFARNSLGAKNGINKWVEDQTNGKIKDLISDINPDAVAMLVNAVYFKASWKSQFQESNNKDGEFKLLNGQTKKVKFMFKYRSDPGFPYAEDSILDIQYLEIPYESDASMLVLLPKKATGLRNLEQKLDANSFKRLSAAANRREIYLTLPKFKFDSSLDATSVLQNIGLTSMFSNSADLTGISKDIPLKVSKAVHKTFIEVNENGTEAAASTAIEIMAISAVFGGPGPVTFKADHPFLFAIRHNPTNLILFIGRVEAF